MADTLGSGFPVDPTTMFNPNALLDPSQLEDRRNPFANMDNPYTFTGMQPQSLMNQGYEPPRLQPQVSLMDLFQSFLQMLAQAQMAQPSTGYAAPQGIPAEAYAAPRDVPDASYAAPQDNPNGALNAPMNYPPTPLAAAPPPQRARAPIGF